MTIYQAMRGQPVDLGRQGEHHARRVAFDISDWVRDFGAGTVRLLHQRQDDAAPYPVSVTRTDNDGITENPETGTLVLWDVTDADTATRQRYGRAELRYYSVGDGGETFLAKSETYQTFVADALGSEIQEAPEGQRGWIDELLDAANGIAENVAAARTAESNAADDANTAHAAAIAAQAAQSEAEAARNAVENMTVSAVSRAANLSASVTKSESASGAVSLAFGIPRGATFTPSVNASGILSWTNDGGKSNPASRNITGPQGETGPQGVQGPVGPQGPQGVQGPQGPKGDKGDTGETGATGPQGEQGPKGDKGDKGDGLSPADLQRISDLESAVTALRNYLRSMEVYRTASGNPATFSDGYANAALKSCVVTITPTLSGTPSAENPVPIPGYDSVAVTRTGENLFDGATTNQYVTANGEINGNGSARLSGYIFVGGATFTVSATPLTASNSETLRVALYDAEKNFIERVTSTRNAASFTVEYPSAAYVRIGWFTTAYSSDGVTLELGNAASGYEAYRGQSVSVSLSPAGRVYGGIVNAVAGTLTVTHGQIASYDGETVPDGWISSTGELSAGAQVVYPLDTPLSYQLTPVSITSLSGYNCVYADAGTVSVTYRADPQISLS